MRVTLLAIILALYSIMLFSIDYSLSGDYQARGIMFNDLDNKDSEFLDNRLHLYSTFKLNDILDLNFNLEVGYVTWGVIPDVLNDVDGLNFPVEGGAIGTRGLNIRTTEMNILYKMKSLKTDIKVGQQYWADPVSLILDDYFSGISAKTTFSESTVFELLYIKANEGHYNEADDDNVFISNFTTELVFPLGFMLLYNDYVDDKVKDFVAIPYVNMPYCNFDFGLTGIVDYYYKEGAKNKIGLGSVIRTKYDNEKINAGLDFLTVNKYGINYLSPWYQNGLQIFGIGKIHDSSNLGWSSAYEYDNGVGFSSLVLNGGYVINDELSAFVTGGLISTLDDGADISERLNKHNYGKEINAGFNYQIIPETLSIDVFGALGKTGDLYNVAQRDQGLYQLGTVLRASF